MLYGFYSDPRSWKIDITSSAFWRPERFGIKIDLHPDAFNIPKKVFPKRYNFFITTEVWEIPMRKALGHLRKNGVKIFLLPREPFKPDELKRALFGHKRFFYNGEYYFNPDVLFAPNEIYAGHWRGKTKVVVTGHPKFDYILKNNFNREKIIKKYNLHPTKKIILFPSYPPYQNNIDDNSVTDIWQAREDTLVMLEDFVKNNTEYQLVAKIHPISFKCYIKKIGRRNEVTGTLLKYYKNPTEYMRVIGDVRMSGDISRELLVASDIVVGFNSTMLLEAIKLNKPVVHLLIGNTSQVRFKDYAPIMPTAYNKEQMFDLIKTPHNSSKTLSDKVIYNLDGKCCKRICNAIKESMI